MGSEAADEVSEAVAAGRGKARFERSREEMLEGRGLKILSSF